MDKLTARADIARMLTLVIIVASISLALVVVILRSIFPEYCCIEGWEPYVVAQSLVDGHGYSFPPGDRWLSPTAETDYTVTAWVDPLYTFLLAGGIWIFGDFHKVLMALFNVLCLGVALILLSYVARRHSGAWAGVLAAAMLAVNFNYRGISHLASSNLQMLCMISSAVLVFSYVRAPSYKRAIVLGIALGLTALACPTALYFMPATAVLLLTNSSLAVSPRVKHAALVMVCGALIVAPWSIRNYLTFDTHVTVRNGGGQIAFVGVNLLGRTLVNENAQETVKFVWASDSASDAVAKSKVDEFRRQLERYQMKFARESGGSGYSRMNEAQRDKWFMEKVVVFIRNNPLVFLELGVAKVWAFMSLFNVRGVFVVVAALVGAMLFSMQPAIRIISLWCALYGAVFVLAIPYFSRYRTPVEPLFCFLAAIFLVRCGRSIAGNRSKGTPLVDQLPD